MNIHRYGCYVFINCLLINSLLSKSISLNDIIAAESNNEPLQSTQIKQYETNVQNYSKNRKFYSTPLHSHITTGTTIPPEKKLSPLKYKKTFQIRTPLRPKKIKYSLRPRSRLINKKREINKNDKFNHNYIPLLKSLGILFNNIIGSNSREDNDSGYNKRLRPISGSEECTCARKPGYKVTEHDPDQAETATISNSLITAKISSKTKTVDLPEAPSTPTHNPFNDNIGSIRRNKNLSVLSPRNSTSSRRNYNGFGKGSLPTHYRNFERHIARNNGSDEGDHSRGTEAESYTEHNKGNPYSISGNNGSCHGSCGLLGGNRNTTKNSEFEATTPETDIRRSYETLKSVRRDSNQFKGFDKFEARSNQTESRKLLSQSNPRLRGYTSQKETTELSWQIQGPEESTFNVTFNLTSNQRISDRNGSIAAEDKEFRRTDKTVTLIDNNLFTSSVNPRSNLSHDKQKIVMIYDGYSIARDVNGDNKIAEKVYRVHS